MIRRRLREGKLLWAFPSGEIEAGESPMEAAIRECREELGIECSPGISIASRVHPHTGRTMRYVSVLLRSDSPKPSVVDDDEIAEVRFVTSDEADVLSGGSIYEPVRDFVRLNQS